MLSSKSFILLHFKFRSIVHFGLISVKGIGAVVKATVNSGWRRQAALLPTNPPGMSRAGRLPTFSGGGGSPIFVSLHTSL